MKIAIVGAGISGLSCAYRLHSQHDIHVFEAAPRPGGHTATIDIEYQGELFAIDTGFIVYNDWTYPNFIQLLNELGVESQPTDMSFSVSCARSGLEYAGSNLNTLFAQRRNLINPKFLRMLRDILRFNNQAVADLDNAVVNEDTTLGAYLQKNNYCAEFRDWYLIPMGSAIWSSSLRDMLDFPLIFFVRFFKNHGLLNIVNRPQWRVIKGGSRSYLEPLTKNFADRIRCNSQIKFIERTSTGALVHFYGGTSEQFDQLILACHADQALHLLHDASKTEEAVLSALPWRNNSVVLHTDTRFLPRTRRTWASWNYLLGEDNAALPCLSYNMNILQGLKSDTTFIVTLNAEDKIDPAKVLGRFNYAHPVFTLESLRAQARKQEIDGANHTWYCGAYWRNGFHEDGCVSGLEVANKINSRAGHDNGHQ